MMYADRFQGGSIWTWGTISVGHQRKEERELCNFFYNIALIHEQLDSARRKIFAQEEDNARRDEEHRRAQAKIS
ncbi:unnamed protein product [Arabis nemorensis]|uniref:Uncharacterized protein n=1 Tax=Arabis nemorensis TaxID=586526 RepID=A0A565CS45_9BRAS|nr:unnamed protein product [Arabis nemorensis]